MDSAAVSTRRVVRSVIAVWVSSHAWRAAWPGDGGLRRGECWGEVVRGLAGVRETGRGSCAGTTAKEAGAARCAGCTGYVAQSATPRGAGARRLSEAAGWVGESGRCSGG